MHSYPKTYLEDAQHNFGVMFDYAIRLLKYDGDQFFLYFIHSEVAQKFEHANPNNKIILANKAASPTRLQKIRKAHGLTQKELSELSGVSLRMIQLYEQRQNDINQASGQTINNLARALCCNFYEIMEIELEEEK